MARFTRVSGLTGRRNTREIDVDPARVKGWDLLGTAAPHVQVAFPELSEDDREFLLNGITPEEWDELLGPEGGVTDPEASGNV